jgi:hypothetical protein
MNATLKLGLTLLLGGLMFFGRIGCTENMQAATKPAHSCCLNPPDQTPRDCARPGCVYVKAKPMVVAAPASFDRELVAAPEIAIIAEQPNDLPLGGAAERPSLAQDDRYLTLHQLLL